MNQRIEELKKQAMIRVNTPTVNSDGKVICDNWEEGISLSKFAELIVKECVRIGQETSKEIFKMSKKEGDIFEYESHGAEQVVDNIKEHFGVEE